MKRKPIPRKRIALAVTAWLIVGLLASQIMAIACTTVRPLIHGAAPQPLAHEWPVSVPHFWPAQPEDAYAYETLAGRQLYAHTASQHSGASAQTTQFGWPILSHQYVMRHWNLPGAPQRRGDDVRGLAILWFPGFIQAATGSERVFIPYMPLFPGYIVSTLFYGGLFAAGWYSPRLIRAALHKHRDGTPTGTPNGAAPQTA